MPIGTAVTSNLALRQAIANSGFSYGTPINTLTAGGGTSSTAQAGATSLRSGINNVIVVPAANASTILPSILSSESYAQVVIVINDAPTNALRVFPAPGEQMNGSTNASLTIVAGGFGFFVMKPQDPSVGGTPPGWSAAAFT